MAFLLRGLVLLLSVYCAYPRPVQEAVQLAQPAPSQLAIPESRPTSEPARARGGLTVASSAADRQRGFIYRSNRYSTEYIPPVSPGFVYHYGQPRWHRYRMAYPARRGWYNPVYPSRSFLYGYRTPHIAGRTLGYDLER